MTIKAFGFTHQCLPALAVGKPLPRTILTPYSHHFKQTTFDSRAFFLHRTVVLLTVPETSTSKHLSGFVSVIDRLKKAGVDKIACAAVSPLDEMQAWQDAHDPQRKILMISDPNGDFIYDMGLGMFHSTPRTLAFVAKRSSMVVKNGVIAWMQVEKNPFQCRRSHASACLEWLEKKRT